MITKEGKTGWGNLKEQVKESEAFRKSTAAWAKHGKAFKGVLNELIGPMAILTGIAAGLALKLIAILRTSQLIGRSLDEWSKIQALTPQFTRLLGSMSAAERRLKEVAKFARTKPFQFSDAAEGNARLQILTRGALATKKGMDLAADAAAVGQTSLTNAAGAIGDLYDAASRNPQAIDNQVEQLRQMGIISTEAADRIRNLAASGVSFTAVWGAVEAELRNNNGAANALGQTITGLQSRLDNVKADNLASIGEMFSEGKMAGMRAAIAFWETFGPILQDILSPIAAITNGFARASEAVALFFKENRGLVAVISMLIKILLTLVTVLAVKSFLDVAKAVLGLATVFGRTAVAARLAAGAARFLATGFGLLFRSVIRGLGPLGLLATALQVVMALMGKQGISGQGALADMVSSVKDETKALQDRVQAMRDGKAGAGAAAETAGAALDNREQARKNREAAKKNLDNAGNNTLLSTLSGAATGALAGSFFGPVGTAVGAVAGGVGGFFAGQSQAAEAQRQYDEAVAAENSATGVFEASKTMIAQTPSEFLNNPAFEAQKAKAKAELDALDAQRAALDQQRQNAEALGDTDAVAKIDEALAEIAAKMKGVSANFSPEAIQREFNKQMIEGDLRQRTAESVAMATGRSDLLEQADKQQDELTRMAAQRRFQDAGIAPEEAAAMADQEVALGQMQRAQQRNPQVASALASAGGAAGEVAGGVNQRQLEVQQRLLETLTSIVPKVGKQDEYNGHLSDGR